MQEPLNRNTDESLTAKLKEGVYVVSRYRRYEPDQIVGVATTLELAAAIVIADNDFWDDDTPVTHTDTEVYGRLFKWVDPEVNWPNTAFQRNRGKMYAEWDDIDQDYHVQWTSFDDPTHLPF